MITDRAYTIPERITLLGSMSAMAGTVYPTIMIYTRGHSVPCPFLFVTGVPCPFCGLTTATVALTHGELQSAAAASPLACVAAVVVVAMLPVLLARIAGIAGPPRPWSPAARRLATRIVSAIVALNWLFELHRFAIL